MMTLVWAAAVSTLQLTPASGSFLFDQHVNFHLFASCNLAACFVEQANHRVLSVHLRKRTPWTLSRPWRACVRTVAASLRTWLSTTLSTARSIFMPCAALEIRWIVRECLIYITYSYVISFTQINTVPPGYVRTPKYSTGALQKGQDIDDQAALAVALDNEATEITDEDVQRKRNTLTKALGYQEAQQLLGYDPSVPLEGDLDADLESCMAAKTVDTNDTVDLL